MTSLPVIFDIPLTGQEFPTDSNLVVKHRITNRQHRINITGYEKTSANKPGVQFRIIDRGTDTYSWPIGNLFVIATLDNLGQPQMDHAQLCKLDSVIRNHRR